MWENVYFPHTRTSWDKWDAKLKFKICLSLFSCAEKYTLQSTHCAVQWWRTKDDKYEVDACKNYLKFPGRERCPQNDCWKVTSTRFNITHSYLVGKFNRKEIYSGWNLFSGDLLSLQRWQQTCGGSHLWHQIDFEVNSMVEIFGNANFVQRCESCCDMEKKSVTS